VKNILIGVSILIIALLFYELFIILIWRKQRRKNIYELALKKSKETGKRLFVIGDPNNDNKSIDGKADYGCGDICLDKETGCDICPNGVKDSLENFLPKLQDNSYVIFASCVLEYVSNFEMVKKELNRVSGGDLFIVHIEPYSLKTNLCPNLGYGKFKRKRIIYSAPPYSKDIKSKELN
jgi:hypothetical protein